MTPSNRRLLAKIKAKLNPSPPPVYKPVDEPLLIARIDLRIIAHHDGDKQREESVLTGFARALKFKGEAELFRVALSDGADFAKRYVEVKPPRYNCFSCAGVEETRELRKGLYEERVEESSHVRRAVLTTFVEEELVHEVIDAMFPWWDERPGLAAARPLRPANEERVEVDDEVLSSIGRDLLALAARKAKAACRSPLRPSAGGRQRPARDVGENVGYNHNGENYAIKSIRPLCT
jgi:hypothetical protein